MDPSSAAEGEVTITMAGTVPGQLEPSAGVTQPPATSAKPRVLKLQTPNVKKSNL